MPHAPPWNSDAKECAGVAAEGPACCWLAEVETKPLSTMTSPTSASGVAHADPLQDRKAYAGRPLGGDGERPARGPLPGVDLRGTGAALRRGALRDTSVHRPAR
jgi:hypothetical protein